MSTSNQIEVPLGKFDQPQPHTELQVQPSLADVRTVNASTSGKSSSDLERHGVLPRVSVASDYSLDIGQATNALRLQIGSNGANISDAWSQSMVMDAQTMLPENNKLDQSALDNRLQSFYNDDGKQPWWKFWEHDQPPAYLAVPKTGDRYYDDNAWIGIASIDQYNKTHSANDLNRAKMIFNFEQTGLDGTDKMGHPGGLRWEKGNDYRSTISNGGAAQLALDLYGLDPHGPDSQKYLDFAKNLFDWVDKNAKAPDGLYLDGLDATGSSKTHEPEFTYNQGLMMGDATKLYEITGDKRYLDEAQGIASKSLAKYGAVNDLGQSGFMQQNPMFNHQFFKNLMMLDEVAPNNSYRKALAQYASDVDKQMKEHNFTYPISDSDKKDNHQILMQSSAIQTLALADQYPPTVD